MEGISLTKHIGGSRRLRGKRERTREGFMKREKDKEERDVLRVAQHPDKIEIIKLSRQYLLF